MPVTLVAPAVRLLVATLLLSGVATARAEPSALPVRLHHSPPDRGPGPLSGRVETGAFVDGMQADPQRLTDFESRIGARAAIASYYYGYGDVFPGETELAFADGGRRKVLLSWDMGPTRFDEWYTGRQDAYLDQIAAAAAAYPYQVFVRPWPEMNGDWQTFQPTLDGDRPSAGTYTEFKRAWRYVVTYVRDHGGENVSWVFNPSADTYPQTTPVARIWPGSAYVDVLGIDGFNWGRDSGWGTWRSFSAIFGAQYQRLTDLDDRLPVWICEVGSKEPHLDDGAPPDPAHSKARWIRALYRSTGFARVTALIWFEAHKERDWRVTSSARSLSAVREILGNRGAGPAGSPDEGDVSTPAGR